MGTTLGVLSIVAAPSLNNATFAKGGGTYAYALPASKHKHAGDAEGDDE